MSKPILDTRKGQCWLCQKECRTECHHVFNGNPNRQRSEEYGLKLYLCHGCHERIHMDQELDESVKAFMQEHAMKRYGWTIEDFRSIFGKNYLEEDEDGEK